jgi:hypothetical protein
MYRIGITATREGLTGAQMWNIIKILRHERMIHDIDGGVEIHHGCCVGGDEQIVLAAVALGCRAVAHPPDNLKFFSKIAFDLSAEKVNEPGRPYLIRNRDIVNDSDELLAAPKEMKMVLRSGTWSTVRYAKALNKKLTIAYQDGSNGNG